MFEFDKANGVMNAASCCTPSRMTPKSFLIPAFPPTRARHF